MSMDFQNKIDIEPILSQVSNVVRKGLNKVLHDYIVKKLQSELDRCRKEMEFYKKELEKAQKYYLENETATSVSEDGDVEEHILLNIEDISDNDSETSIEHLLNSVKVNTANTQIKTVLFTKTLVQEEADDEADEEVDEEADDEAEEEADDEVEEEAEEEADDEAAGAGEDTSEAEEEEEEEDTSEAAGDTSEAAGDTSEAAGDTSEAAGDTSEAAGDTSEAAEDKSEAAVEEDTAISRQALKVEAKNEDDIETEEESEAEDTGETDEEDEEEVFEIEIEDVTYFATSEENGPLYAVDESGEPGIKVGYLKDGEPFFFSDGAK
jgi:hypothetical protein